MQRIDGRFVYSASDLNGYLECAALTQLEREAAERLRVRPDPDEATQLIARKGDEHERRYLETLLQRGLDVCEIPHRENADAEGLREAERATLAAMERGAQVVYQATFFDGTFMGHADFLRRVERPCALWDWSYEVLDTKLALSTKTYFLVQLCNYSEHVARLQGGTMPERIVVIPGNNVEAPYDVAEYLAYYRHLKASFLTHANARGNGAYPHEVPHCRVCRWSPTCEQRRDEDDYLGLVAWMRLDDVRRLDGAGITTIAQLADASETARPDAMKPETFERLRAQARLQHVTRTTGALRYELLPSQPARGFALLPEPDEGDVFFDMEGDPLYTPERGLEYLFGVYLAKEDRYVAYWARSDREERAAFESLVDFLEERRAAYPSMHVYHYAPYETTALKRLSGYYATREEALDTLLRAQAFVDLYAVVRQGLRISQPSYSIKKLEPFYGFKRDTKTQRGDDSILMFESWLVDGDDNILIDIENYNRDDCISTLQLRDWLLERRTELATRDGAFPWKPAFEPKQTAEDPQGDERTALRERLLSGLESPESLAALRAAPEAYRGPWLLGHLLDYHRRDEKPGWWAYFHRCDNQDELVDFDREAIGGLRYRSDVEPYLLTPRQKNRVHVFDFPDQLHGFEPGKSAWVLDAAAPREAGDVVALDEDALQIHLKLQGSVDPSTLDAIAPTPSVFAGEIRESIARVAASYLDGTLEQRHPALVDVLLRRRPRLAGSSGDANLQPDVPDAESITALARRLDGSYLFVQGPPGTGKSTAGAGVILNLIASGKRVAILANSHKVIHNLLHKIEEQAVARGQRFTGIQRYSKSTPGSRFESRLPESLVTCSADTAALAQPHDLSAGTAWTFAREASAGAYDYLFIDEAGQVSLANAIACAPCARNVVLLGDPLQLAQVSQGAHPPGIELSVMAHLLGDHATIPQTRGVFLDHSYRMQPDICAFISQSVYAGRLSASDATAQNRIESVGLTGGGLRYVPIAHEGNQRESREEADALAEMVTALLRGRVRVARAGGSEDAACSPDEILVVTPYNAQRRLIHARLAAAGVSGVRVGTVDKFQGQEAPVVFYSMATSSGDDLPRDVGFLFERNRLNVAISRAQCMSVLVCSPRLLEIRCSTPEQMALVNLLCRFVELAS